MSRYFRLILIIPFLLITLQGFGQGYNIGIRAGIGQNKFVGPLETDFGESYDLTGGFHFGLNFQLNFSDLVGWRSEIVYNQMGSSYSLDTPNGYYVFRPNDNSTNIIIRDTSQIKLNHSNAYLQLPQTIHIKIGNKLEVFGGGYIGFLLSPTAAGTILFGGANATREHSFIQGLSFNYFSDDANTRNRFGFNPGTPRQIRANGKDVTLDGITNSWEFMQFNLDESRFFKIDYGLVLGASYYLNRGLYIMGRLEYGARDITRNSVDYSFARVNDDETPIFKNDSDKNFGIYLSIGFKF